MRKYLPLLFIALLACTSCTKEEAIKPVNMTIAAEMSLLPATVWVAEKLSYFKEVGLNLTIREFDSGRNALESMLKDKTINMATVAQTPIVFNSFNKEDYVIIATMAHSFDDVKVLARKDHGIKTAKDLRGKKIGATLRSTGHYFLEGFLSNHGMNLKDIKLYDVNAAKLKDKLISGELDAITSWEPHIYNTKKILDESKLTLLISPIPFRKDFFFTVNKTYAENNKEHVTRFLKAVLKAEKYINEHQAEAQKIMAEKIGADPVIVKNIWDAFIFEITLEQSILVSLEDEAQWAIDIGHTKKSAPNYLDFIHYQNLENLKPEAVNIIR
ncbi:MAG: ABC transporter substrate-binding protein [Gammaproteobacteria bacterium]|nr:ABC transporter substrate-binding protein [Gammaproteobacteria bacterium]